MAAVILNDDDDLQDDGNLTPEKLETPAQEEEEAPAPAKEKPSKFKGKTPEEIEAAYEELEKRFGAQGAEIGELRKLSDQFIRSSLEKKSETAAPPKQEPSTDADVDAEFFINPRKAIKKLLEEDEVIADLRKHKAESQQDRARRVTLEKHPDAADLVRSEDFATWVNASPIRQQLFANAQQNYDDVAADELFSTFKEIRAARAPKAEAKVADTSIIDAQKKAAGSATGTTGSAEVGKGKPVFSRRKLMELKINNPDEYEARSDEILRAYAEGRVKP